MDEGHYILPLERIIALGRDTKAGVPSNVLRNALSSSYDNSIQLYIYLLLRDKLVDPDSVMLQSITSAVNDRNAHIIGICLRYGADSNMYVNSPSLGPVHIMAYTHAVYAGSVGYRRELMSIIVAMLFLSGSNVYLPYRDEAGGRYNPADTRRYNPADTRRYNPHESVLEWIRINQFESVIFNLVDQRPFPQTFIDKVSAITDRPNGIKNLDLYAAVSSRSNDVVDRYVSGDPNGNLVMTLSTDLVNRMSLQSLLKTGYIPTYTQMNNLILMSNRYSKRKLLAGANEVNLMIEDSVKYGADLDKYQLAMITSPEFSKQLLDAYGSPRWSKLCKSGSKTTHDEGTLKSLAVSLNLDPSDEKMVCESLSKLSRADEARIIEASERRQQARISDSVSTPYDFISGNNSTQYVCANRSLMTSSPSDIPDVDLWYYKDNKGQVWCFEGESFESVLDTGINPYSMKPISEIHLMDLRRKYDMRSSIGSHLNSYSEAIKSLKSKDDVSNLRTNKSLNNMYRFLAQNGIPRQSFDQLTSTQLSRIADSIGMRNTMQELNTPHARATLSRIVSNISARDPNIGPIFIDSVKKTLDLY